MATIYRADGTKEDVQPKNGKDFKLEELQEIVGGLIDALGVNDDEIMVFNDEGKLMGLPYNQEATCIFRQRYKCKDYIVGDVLVCKNTEML